MRRRTILGKFLTVPLTARLAFADDWPQFRGPSGQGQSAETGLPDEWSETANIRWKTPIPGSGWSSPAIANGRIWLTSSVGRAPSLRLVSLDGTTGEIDGDFEVIRVRDKGPGINAKNSFASPTAIVSGERIYVHFGFYGTACVSATGDVLWKQTLKYEPQHGPGGSPILFENLLIVSCDGFDVQFVAALDTETGKIRWKTPRGRGNQAYTTPLLIEVDGKPQVISPGGYRACAYDPRNGKELWHIEYGDGFSNVPAAVYAHGLVYICSGFFQPALFAVRPDGRGNVTKSHVAWSYRRAVPLTSSPVVSGEELYMVSDNGIGTCLDARTGEAIWQRRLGGNYSASPVAAEGRIYFLNEEGETLVLASGREYKELARNSIGERTLASLAVAGKAIFLRGERNLYRIEKQA